MRQHVILHLDGADCVFGGRFIYSGYRSHFIARPEDFRPGGLNDSDGLDAGHFLGGGGVDAGDTRMRIGAAKDLSSEQAVGIVVVGVFGAAGNLYRAVNSRNALAQQRTSRRIGPLVLAHDDLLSCEEASATARIPS